MHANVIVTRVTQFNLQRAKCCHTLALDIQVDTIVYDLFCDTSDWQSIGFVGYWILTVYLPFIEDATVKDVPAI